MPFDVEDDNEVSSGLGSNPNLIYSTDSKTPIDSKGSQSKRKMWYLGIVSSNLPNEIMQEVFRALKVTGFVRMLAFFSMLTY
jgi:hypothetical protein